ncbi:DUF3137 domain-containing protein [Photobacterium kagoshimensis]|uniref:DUF3137 domain-containing protein n=1 Tax=Photobacterium kagoshimensis TaxID=2910242 RepID=UPI003D0BB8F1
MEVPFFRIPNYQRKAFTQYYQQKIFPKCQKLEQQRLDVQDRLMRRRIIGGPFYLLSALVLFASLLAFIFFIINANHFSSEPYPIYAFAVASVSLIIKLAFSSWINGEQADFTNETHRLIFPLVLKYFGKKFKLNPHNEEKTRSKLGDLKQHGIFPEYSSMEISDHLEGCWKGNNFNFYELSLKTSSDQNNVPKILFKGALIQIQQKKRFSSTVCVVQDKGWRQSSKHNDLSRVKLEDPRFEKEFEVYGSDQVEARYLLTPNMMETLSELNEHFGGKVEACFKDKLLTIKIPTKRDFFSATLPMNEPLNYQQTIESLFSDMEYIFTLAELLKQNNTRL